MGKKTLYHPVSLNNIRGGIESAGISVGRIRQTSVDHLSNSATYNVELLKMSRYHQKLDSSMFMYGIEANFAGDVEVLRYGMTHHADGNKVTRWIDIRTTANAPFDTTEEAEASDE
jgi:hypothetical protein